MVLNDDGPPTVPISLLPTQRALIETHSSPSWRYTEAGTAEENSASWLTGNRTRRARALLKRLDAQEHAKNKSRL